MFAFIWQLLCVFAMCLSAKPTPPSNLTVTDVTMTSFKISWIKGDGGGYEQTFHVSVRYALVSYQ